MKLLVYVPGLPGLLRRPVAAELLRRLAEHDGGAWQVRVFPHGVKPWSTDRLEDVAHRLSVQVRTWAGDNGVGEPVEEVRLVGHSLGGLLVRHAFLLDSGAAGDEGRQYPWTTKVHRIVLLAAPNAGFRAERMPLWMRAPFVVAAASRRLTVEELQFGSPYLTELRLRWVRAFRDEAAPRPEVVQALGDRDDLVRRDDSLDVEYMENALRVDVPGAEHADLVEVSDAPDDERYAVLRHAIFGDLDGRAALNAVPVKGAPVYFVLHGIRTGKYAGWVGQLSARLVEHEPGAVVRTPSYGYLSAVEFAIPFTRSRNLRHFLHWYSKLYVTHGPERIRFAGHSNGTYLLGQALRKVPAMHFERVYLAASVLPREYDWSTVEARKQVGCVHSDRATHDIPVGWLCAALRGLGMRDIGTAGVTGFDQATSVVTEDEHAFCGGHGKALTGPERIADVARFLKDGLGDDPVHQPTMPAAKAADPVLARQPGPRCGRQAGAGRRGCRGRPVGRVGTDATYPEAPAHRAAGRCRRGPRRGAGRLRAGGGTVHRMLLDEIRAAVIGDDEVIEGPYGARRVTYADYTASGRSLAFIEAFIRDEVLPRYANTHTETSGTGRQTTRFREEARAIISAAVGASREEYAVLFCGAGSTAAIDKMVHVLGLRIPAALDDRYDLRAHVPVAERPVVFIGPYEHHSNELPWRESIADVVVIHEDANGHVDLDDLAARLAEYADRPLKIGSFSAASNVTGIVTDTRAVADLLHAHGALSFWDYAAAGPYVAIDMADGDLDAIFLSPHKFIGGPGTPGVLVARRSLFTNRVPTVPGGGTVSYVNPFEHRYLDDVECREEGGTPAIVDSIRAGLVFQLKEAVGVDVIREREASFIKRAVDAWRANPNIEILGNLDADRLSIVSFVVRHGQGRYLHHNFVVAVLNDLFGIQARGGCSCAGPYGHRLLGIDLDRSHEFEREITRGCEGIKPGWVRVNFNYFITDTVFEYVLDAVDLVASDGWRLLPHYTFEPNTGVWQHVNGPQKAPMSLHDVSYDGGRFAYPRRHSTEPESALAGYLAEARRIVAEAAAATPEPYAAPTVSDDFEHLRWFPLPGEPVSG